MFTNKNKKNNVYPCKTQFYYIKMGFKGVKIIKVCFHDAENARKLSTRELPYISNIKTFTYTEPNDSNIRSIHLGVPVTVYRYIVIEISFCLI